MSLMLFSVTEMQMSSFFCSTLKTQVAYGDDAYYYLEDDKSLTVVPYHQQDGILWNESVTYDPSQGASDDSTTAECDAAFKLLLSF